VPLAQAEHRYTYADYLTWSGEERWVQEPLDRVLMIWRYEQDGFGAPEILALEGTASSRIADLHLHLDQLARLLEDV